MNSGRKFGCEKRSRCLKLGELRMRSLLRYFSPKFVEMKIPQICGEDQRDDFLDGWLLDAHSRYNLTNSSQGYKKKLWNLIFFSYIIHILHMIHATCFIRRSRDFLLNPEAGERRGNQMERCSVRHEDPTFRFC